MDATHDAIIIGAGQAGPALALKLLADGRRVALVEEAQVGGTCLNSGCRPTKALRASARVAHLARRAAHYGVEVGPVSVDLAAAMTRKDRMIDAWRTPYREMLESRDGLDFVRGHGRFAGTEAGVHRVAVGERTVAAPMVILNVGARARVPDIEGLDGVGYLTNESVLHLKERPRHLVVLGGSYIGLELGQLFARFGSEVTVVEQSPRIVSREDPDISEALAAILEGEGLTLRTGVAATRVGREGEDLLISLGDGSEVRGSHLLLAIGRVPNTDRLGLETVGLVPNARGYLETDGVFRTAVAGIYAVGDVNGRGAFTHTAYQDHEILADHLAGGTRSADGRVMTYAVFTDPPLGRVGMTEAEAQASGRRVLKATYPMAKLTKAVLDGETDGLVKILVDADSDRFLGATCLGLYGDEIVQVVSALIHADAPCRVLAEMLPVHPTVAEFFPTILGRLEPLE